MRETRVTEPPWVMFVTNLGENMVWWRKVIRIKQIEEVGKLFMVIIKTGQHSNMDYVDTDVDDEVHSLGAWQL